MSLARGRFGRGDRIRRRADFQRASRIGRRRVGRSFIVLVSPNDPRSGGGVMRLGLTVSRKVGGSVERNRVKRRVREWFRRARYGLEPGMDWVVIARAPAKSLSFVDLTAELDQLSVSLRGKNG